VRCKGTKIVRGEGKDGECGVFYTCYSTLSQHIQLIRKQPPISNRKQALWAVFGEWEHAPIVVVYYEYCLELGPTQSAAEFRIQGVHGCMCVCVRRGNTGARMNLSGCEFYCAVRRRTLLTN
jgi:hypothetical protein